LRLTVSQSVSLCVEPHLGLMTRYLLLFDSYGLVFLGSPLVCCVCNRCLAMALVLLRVTQPFPSKGCFCWLPNSGFDQICHNINSQFFLLISSPDWPAVCVWPSQISLFFVMKFTSNAALHTVHIFTTCFCKIHFNIILQFMSSYQKYASASQCLCTFIFPKSRLSGLYLRDICKQKIQRGVTRSYDERKREKVNNVVQQFAVPVGKRGVGKIMHRACQARNSVMQKRRREPTRGFAETTPPEPRTQMLKESQLQGGDRSQKF
jgi:hypothetical protein